MNPTQYAIEQELELLRKRYREEPDRRFIFEIQAKMLKLALEANTPKQEIKTTHAKKNDLIQAAEEYLQ